MTTVLLFHHALGQTTVFLAFAEELREAGHTVHTPDLFDGKTFGDIDEGVANAKQVGFGEIIRRGSAAAEELSADIVLRGSHSAAYRRSPWPRRGRVREGRCSSTPPCRPPSSTARGPRACRSRST